MFNHSFGKGPSPSPPPSIPATYYADLSPLIPIFPRLHSLARPRRYDTVNQRSRLTLTLPPPLFKRRTFFENQVGPFSLVDLNAAARRPLADFFFFFLSPFDTRGSQWRPSVGDLNESAAASQCVCVWGGLKPFVRFFSPGGGAEFEKAALSVATVASCPC